MSTSQRQEVFNVTLAELLQERGVIARPESIIHTGVEKTRQMPDVIVNYQGLLTAIEGEVEAPDAREKAIASAAHRVETRVARLGIAVVYPANLRQVPFHDLKNQLAHAPLQISVVTENGDSGFTIGGVDYLERALRSTFEQLVAEDIVADSVALIDEVVDRFAGTVLPYKGIWGRITVALGGSGQELGQLTEQQRGANCRIGGLVLINAMIFHDILSAHYPKITSLDDIITQDMFEVFPAQWQHILDEINYFSIFHLAREVLLSVSKSVWGVSEVLTFMAKTAARISERRAALRHDLMGRIYHRLLAEAKYLGTYYTSIPAATLLLKLALRPIDGWPLDWSDVAQVSCFRIADLSCGTGTLLMAAADAIIDNYVSFSAGQGKAVALENLHKQLAESILYGYDVLPSAIHLTASTLALRTPDVAMKRMNLFCLPFGGPQRKLGSIEFLRGRYTQMPLDMFGALPKPQQVTGQTMEELASAPLPDLDLCVMNPPFVRSVIGNLLFGSLPEEDRKPMQHDLQELVRDPNVRANINAGLGSVFVAVGDQYVKPGGRIALVLPKALLSGVSWKETRDLIGERYQVEYVIASQDPNRWNFSESTDLSEVLLVARKHDAQSGREHGNGRVVSINLWRNPANTLEALAVANTLLHNEAPDLVAEQGALEIWVGAEKFGEVLSTNWADFQEEWMLPAAFAQSDLIRVGYHLMAGELWLPGYGTKGELPLCTLGELVSIGPDGRDIHDGFDVTDSTTAYPALWGHKSEEISSMAQEPNRFLMPLKEAKPTRPLRKLDDLWPKASRLQIGARIWLKTQNVMSVRLSQPALSNVWWPISLKGRLLTEQNEKALTLWLNSTLSLSLLLISRQETRGAWIQFKKPVLEALPVLDIRALAPGQLSKLAAAYDQLCRSELRPFPEMGEDEVRSEVDNTIARVLNLPDFSFLRVMLAREPVVCMQRIS